MSTTKIDSTTIEVTKQRTPTVNRYEYGFLKEQLVSIQAFKDSENAKRDAEIAEVVQLIADADALGVKERTKTP